VERAWARARERRAQVALHVRDACAGARGCGVGAVESGGAAVARARAPVRRKDVNSRAVWRGGGKRFRCVRRAPSAPRRTRLDQLGHVHLVRAGASLGVAVVAVVSISGTRNRAVVSRQLVLRLLLHLGRLGRAVGAHFVPAARRVRRACARARATMRRRGETARSGARRQGQCVRRQTRKGACAAAQARAAAARRGGGATRNAALHVPPRRRQACAAAPPQPRRCSRAHSLGALFRRTRRTVARWGPQRPRRPRRRRWPSGS
jgi:hypothetical protein